MRRPKATTLAALLGIILMLAALALYALEVSRYPSLTVFDGKPIGSDFPAYWAAGQLIKQGLAEGVYVSQMISHEIAQFNLGFAKPHKEIGMMIGPIYYPPVYLLLLGLLGFLPYFTALLALFLSSAALFFTGIWQLVRTRWIPLLMCGYAGIWLNLVSGQNGLLTAGFMALALSQLNRNQVLAGILIGLSCYKPHLGLLWPFVLIAGGYTRAFYVATLTVIGLIAYTFVVFGFETWILYSYGAEFAVRAMAEHAQLWIRMPTLYAMLRLMTVDFNLALLLQIIFDLFVVVAVIIIWRRTQVLTYRGAALAVGALLATPFVYDYDYAILGIAFVLLLQQAQLQGWRRSDKILLPLAYIWPIFINHFASKTKLVLGGHLQLGFLLPLALLVLIYLRVAPRTRIDSPPSSALQQQA